MKLARSCLGVLLLASAWGCSKSEEAKPFVPPEAPKDGWSAEFTFRDTNPQRTTHRAMPPGGWLLTPLHGHVLPTGKVLLHGGEKETPGASREDPYTLFNDANWILDPADPRLASPTDADISMDLMFPPTRSASDPNGLIRRDDQILHEIGENIQCGGHTYLDNGVLFYTGGTAFIVDDDPNAPPEADKGGLISMGMSGSALFNASSTAIGGAAPGWSSAPPHTLGPRYYPTSTRLSDGRIVVSSGYFDTQDFPNVSVELFDPATSQWSVLVPGLPRGETTGPADPRRFLYPDAEDYVHGFTLPTPWPAGVPADNSLARQVALIGVTGQIHLLATDGGTGLDRVYLSPGGRRPGPEQGTDAEAVKRHEGSTSILLPDGRIMMMGGTLRGGYGLHADIYDPRPGQPTFDTWEQFNLCDDTQHCVARHAASSLFLPDGRVLLLGGRAFEGHDGAHPPEVDIPVVPTEDDRRPIFVEWEQRKISLGTPWPELRLRAQHNVSLLLPDGRILLAGGRIHACDPACLDEQSNMRLYSPPYLDPGLAPHRPAITSVTDAATGAQLQTFNGVSAVALGSTLKVNVSSDSPTVAAMPLRFALVALGSATHRFDMNLRYLPLTSSAASKSGTVDVQIPSDDFKLLRGPYMFFAIRTVPTKAGTIDVPSVARIVMVR
jgi:hypothetical protein